MIELENGARVLKQWQQDKRVVIDNFFPGTRVEFSKRYDCKDSALPVLAYEDGDHVVADIPNILLQEPGYIRVSVLPSADDAESDPEIKDFKVVKAEKPEDYIYSETKTISYQALEQRVAELEKNGGSGVAVSPTACVEQTETGATITVTDKNGTTTATVRNGRDGKTPIKGTDYFTTDEVQSIAEQAAGLVEVPDDDHINSLINTAFGVIENGTY